MEIGINSGYLAKTRQAGRKRTVDEQVRLCAEAGFRVLDSSIDAWSENWEEQADAIMDAAAKYGVTVIQSHAPYNFYRKEPPEVYHKALMRSVDAAVRMGVKDLVFHADEYHPARDGLFDPKEGLERSYAVLAPCVERLIAGGVRAAMETNDEDRGPNLPYERRTHFSGEMDELASVFEKFNDPMVTCCWDFGHAKLSVGSDGARHVEAIRRLGKYITCTHVHDNYHGGDLHLPPFLGDANWEELMAALRGTGYTGALTFEMVYGCQPEEQVEDFLRQLHKTGEILVGMFEGK